MTLNRSSGRGACAHQDADTSRALEAQGTPCHLDFGWGYQASLIQCLFIAAEAIHAIYHKGLASFPSSVIVPWVRSLHIPSNGAWTSSNINSFSHESHDGEQEGYINMDICMLSVPTSFSAAEFDFSEQIRCCDPTFLTREIKNHLTLSLTLPKAWPQKN